jgi:hypothetical protein
MLLPPIILARSFSVMPSSDTDAVDTPSFSASILHIRFDISCDYELGTSHRGGLYGTVVHGQAKVHGRAQLSLDLMELGLIMWITLHSQVYKDNHDHIASMRHHFYAYLLRKCRLA